MTSEVQIAEPVAATAGEAAPTTCRGRREFMVQASITAGGLLLGLTGMAERSNAADPPADLAADDVLLKLTDDSPLAKRGGFQTIDTRAGKVVVARTGANTYAACSAVCPHRNGPIQYDVQTEQFFCPLHNSRFDQQGKVLRGPARQPLTSYASQSAAVVSIKTEP